MRKSIVKCLTLPLLIALLVVATTVFSASTFPMEVKDIKTLDEEGNPKTSFRRGDLVLVQATVDCPFMFYAPPQYNFLFIVKFVNSQGVTFYYGVIYGSLQPGKNATYAVGGKIPEGAPTGTYRAYIYVWSNWPAYETPTAYAEVKSVDFTVTGG
ncbi:MAG: hypothetical protein QW320_07895 [Ignisphaera sp.]